MKADLSKLAAVDCVLNRADHKQKINVLVLESTLIFGGVENLLLNVFTRLDESRFAVTFCTLYHHGPMGPKFIEKGFRLEHSLIRNKFDPRALWRLNRLIRRESIDLIYLVTQPLTLFWGFLAAKLNRLPMICQVGNTLEIGEHPKLRLYRLLLPQVDVILAQAELQKKHLVENQKLPAKLLRVIQNGVDCRAFETVIDRSAKLKSLGLPADAKVIGANGRMVKLKGIDVLIEAARKVMAQDSRVHLVLVGTGPDREEFERQAQSLEIFSRIHFLGFREDLRELTQLYDVAVLASRTEAFPIAILEYMASGRPIVATAVGSVPEVLEHEVSGLLVHPERPDELANGILRLLREPELARGLAGRAKEMVLNNYDIAVTARNTERLISELAIRKSKL